MSTRFLAHVEDLKDWAEEHFSDEQRRLIYWVDEPRLQRVTCEFPTLEENTVMLTDSDGEVWEFLKDLSGTLFPISDAWTKEELMAAFED